MDPTRQALTGQEASQVPEGDPDADWDALAGDTEAIYLDEGEPTGRTADAMAAPEPDIPEKAPDLDIDFAAMKPEQRVEKLREITGNPDLPADVALALADGHMRHAHYTQGRQQLAEDRRAMQAILQQAGYRVPEGQSIAGFLAGMAQPQFAPPAPQAPMPPQAPAGPPEPSDPYDVESFIRWWNATHNGENPTQGDYQRWKDEKVIAPVRQQVQQDEQTRALQRLQNEWADITREFEHAKEPGVDGAVEQEIIQRLQSGVPPYPGMVREIYLRMYADEAYSRRSTQQRQRRQAPPVPPAGPTGGGRPRGAEPPPTTSEGILARQLANEGLIGFLDSTMGNETDVYEAALQQHQRRRR